MRKTENADRMAKARAAKRSDGGRASRVEVEHRVGEAFRLLLFNTRTETHSLLMEQFDCCSSSADAAIARARVLMQEECGRAREDHLSLALAQLEAMIASESGKVRLDAIKAKIELLGLAAPARSEVNTSITTYDPVAQDALSDPAIREAALSLEESIESFRNEN